MAGGPARIARVQDVHGRGAREALATAVPTAILRLGGGVDRAVQQAAQGAAGSGAPEQTYYDDEFSGTTGISDINLTLPTGHLWFVSAKVVITMTVTSGTAMQVATCQLTLSEVGPGTPVLSQPFSVFPAEDLGGSWSGGTGGKFPGISTRSVEGALGGSSAVFGTINAATYSLLLSATWVRALEPGEDG